MPYVWRKKIENVYSEENYSRTFELIVTAPFMQNVNESNNKSFPQHISSNVVVSESFPGGKGMTQEDLYT